MRAGVAHTVLAAGLWLILGGCLSGPTPVGVEPRNEEQLHLELDTCALHGDSLSPWTSWVLRLLEAEDEFEEDPLSALKRLHERALLESSPTALFSLAEISYLAGKRSGDREFFLAAALYAYFYLLPGDARPTPSPYDRRFRWACDIYNRSLVLAFQGSEKGTTSFQLTEGTHALPGGPLHVEIDFSGFPYETTGLELLATDRLHVRGLGMRVRDSGLGAPLIAIVGQRGEGTAGVGILERTSLAATAFLRPLGGLADLAGGLQAKLELYSTYDQSALEIGGQRVPLESDLSATVAYGIQSADLWKFDLLGFFAGRDAGRENGLILPRPFQPGRIPVVLVHGTASNPSYWAELGNALSADPLIRSRYQFWYFIYSSGNPVAYSAATLRRSLRTMLEQHDPHGEDAALHRMVIVGHSQGGLLTKMTGVTMDADEGAQAILGAPFSELGFDDEQLALLRECFDLHPLPFVERLVFLATPHRGSFLAASWFSRLLAKMIAVPAEFATFPAKLAGKVPKKRLPPGMESRVPTSLDNMNPTHPVLLYLADIPIDPRIRVHSIIPIGDAQDPHGADDGVVEYESAHLEGVDSEILVPSKHSCQSHPRTLIELRRILHEHLASAPAEAAPAPQ